MRLAIFCCAIFILMGFSPKTRAGGQFEGDYHIETHFKQRIIATLTTTVLSPKTVDGTLTVYAPIPPELPMQHLVSCDIRCLDFPSLVPTKVADLKNQFQRYLRLDIPITPTTLQHPCAVDMTYVMNLYSAKLVPGLPPTNNVASVLPTAFSVFTHESRRDDFNSPAFRGFLESNGLRKEPSESSLNFAYRVYQFLRSKMHYVGHPFPEKASTFCQTLTGDCGVYAVMSASTLAANGVPVATFPGRWASDGTSNYGQYHCFNGFFEPGIGWITFDALNDFGSVNGNFIAFSLTSDDCPEPGIVRPLWQFQIGIYHGHSPYHPKFEDHWHVRAIPVQ